MRMSLQDFCSCTPSEFRNIYEVWYQNETRRSQERWEMTRELAMFSLLPHTSKPLDKKKVMPFPWDKQPERKEKGKVKESTPDRVSELIKRIEGNGK